MVFHFCSTENTIQKYDHNIPKGTCSHFSHLSGTCDTVSQFVHTTNPALKIKMDFAQQSSSGGTGVEWPVQCFQLSPALNLLCNLPQVTSLLWDSLSSSKEWGLGDYSHSFGSHHLAKIYTLLANILALILTTDWETWASAGLILCSNFGLCDTRLLPKTLLYYLETPSLCQFLNFWILF